MLRIGKSTSGMYLNRETFESLSKAGFNAVEISYPVEGYDNIDYGNVKALADEFGIELWSFHFPFMPFDKIDISNPSAVDGTIELCSEYIDKASAIGIKHFVIHPSGEPIAEEDRPARLACAKDGLSRLSDYAKTKGAVICVESLPRTCLGRDSFDILELLSANDDLRCCFDTNHLLTEDPVDFAKKVGAKIATTHISDCDFLNERHWLPGSGLIRWHELYNEFVKFGYDGVWMYELGFGSGGGTYFYEQFIGPDEFIKNAREIFEGKEITRYGHPAPDLKHWTDR